jgi:hypothetical protein
MYTVQRLKYGLLQDMKSRLSRLSFLNSNASLIVRAPGTWETMTIKNEAVTVEARG